MASKSPIKGILKRTGRSSKQEPEWKPSFPSNAVPTPNRYGPHPRQTTGPRREIFLSSSSVSAPPTSSVPLHSTSNYSTKFRSVSPVTSANLPSTNYELDHEDQPAQSLAPNIIQMTQLPPPNSEHSTAPWVLASREHHKPKKPMDVEFITRLADIRRQADGDSSSTSSRSGSLALLGSRCGSIASSTFSQSFSVASLPQAVEFPPGPVFTDALPAELIEKLKLLAVEPTPKAPALKNSYYPLQNSRTVITTRSLETTHEADNSSSTSSSPNSTPRQQLMQFAAPTKSIPYYAPNPSCYTPCPQTKTPTQTTPSSNVVQQPSGLTFASTAAPRTTKPFSLSPQPSNHSPPPMISPEHNPAPPNKETLKFGWNRFTLVKSPKGDPFDRALDTADHPVFRKPLKESLRCTSCQISTENANGDLYVLGYIPTVIAKCGLYLKENATEVPGIFSVSGSNRRMRDLQAAFESPPDYGRSLEWKKESYTTHDIASVFRRYLAQLPEPVIPYYLYHPFRDPWAKEPFDQEQLIDTYKTLILRMPCANQYLFLYVLHLLSVFASKHDKNLMTATNLAVIFRPSFISHPKHEINYKEHALSQKVLEFLIPHQDLFIMSEKPRKTYRHQYGAHMCI